MSANNLPDSQPEPWLRGTHVSLPAIHRAVIHALELAAEDCEAWCGGLTLGELNASPHGLPSVAFHLRHLAGSLDRLLTYAEGSQLNQEQFAELQQEKTAIGSREELWDAFRGSLQASAARVRALRETDVETARTVGRQAFPATVGALLVHVADHTQRHVGQAITTTKVVVALRSAAP